LRQRDLGSARPSGAGGSCGRWAASSSSWSRSTALLPRPLAATVLLGDGAPRHAGLDHPRDLERDHGRRLEQGSARRPLGRGGAAFSSLGRDAPGHRARGRAGLGRPCDPGHPIARCKGAAALVRLIPRDEEFTRIFIRDGENLLAAARALESWSSRTIGSTSASAAIQGPGAPGRRDRRGDRQAPGARLHHAVRPRGHPRASPAG